MQEVLIEIIVVEENQGKGAFINKVRAACHQAADLGTQKRNYGAQGLNQGGKVGNLKADGIIRSHGRGSWKLKQLGIKPIAKLSRNKPWKLIGG